jgi:hypothetical protein
MFDEYLKYLDGPYKQLRRIQEAGIIDWSVHTTVPRSPGS